MPHFATDDINASTLPESADTIWATEDISRDIINVLVVINIDKPENITEQIKTIVSNKIFKQSKEFLKLTSIRIKSMGYHFLLRDQVTVDDIVSTLNFERDCGIITESVLQKTISEYSNRPLPKNDSALWEILVSPNPVQWKRSKGQANVYPILMRFSHIVGDGLSLTNFALRTLAMTLLGSFHKTFALSKTKDAVLSNPVDGEQLNVVTKAKACIQHILEYLRIILIAPTIIFMENFVRKEDVNDIHGCQLSGDKILVYAVEEDTQMISVVKKIKAAVPESTFSDVLLTGISGTLAKYFKNKKRVKVVFKIVELVVAVVETLEHIYSKVIVIKQKWHMCMPGPHHMLQTEEEVLDIVEDDPLTSTREIARQVKNSQFVPDFATAVLPILLSPPNMDQNPILENQFSVALLDLPILISSMSMIERLEKCDNVNNILLKWLCGLIPDPLLRRCLKNNKLTMTISSVPGLPKMSVLNGCENRRHYLLHPTQRNGRPHHMLQTEEEVLDIVEDDPSTSTREIARQLLCDISGVGFSILTYDNRFQLGLAVDKSIISSTDKAQLLVDGILKHINSLYEELLADIHSEKDWSVV
ncbi:hypothetical protein NQ317_013573 [Molorchus minor]|uniref:O-acyltransferase WSD1 C-terminal domain-containing protein n=1 Tax=Molorchus minor TaxID=1323400 RepID=A0ABQ9J2Q2_9CUCU|nr:hypothetical protein NQ317_013573 [Molorchus minor]